MDDTIRTERVAMARLLGFVDGKRNLLARWRWWRRLEQVCGLGERRGDGLLDDGMTSALLSLSGLLGYDALRFRSGLANLSRRSTRCTELLP